MLWSALPVDAKVYRMLKSYLGLATVALVLFGFGFVSLAALPILKPVKNAWLLVIPGLAVTGGLSALSSRHAAYMSDGSRHNRGKHLLRRPKSHACRTLVG